MATGHQKKSLEKFRKALTKNDIKLLICVMVFAISVALKYADFDAARNLRAQATSLLHGGTNTGEVIEAMGKAVGEDGVLAVFDGQGSFREVFAGTNGKALTEVRSGTDTNTATEVVTEELMPAYAEGGYSEDLENREETLFPKEVDETAYVMRFAHVQPVAATLTSDYGARTHPITGKQSYHFGLDLAAPKGTPIASLADGNIRETGNGSYGNYLIVDHADGFSTLYAHCDKLIAKKGEVVRIGQEIAQVGATGNATGNHLHFEIWRDGKALDPNNYVTYA